MKTFEDLFGELQQKVNASSSESRTVQEYNEGIHHICKKLLEESGEVWLAAEHESNDRTAEEMSQLLYHLQVLMLARGLTPEDLYRYL